MSLPMKWILLDGGILEERREVDAAAGEVGLEAREVADRRVEPDVEVLARVIGDGDAEVRRVAGDVPVGELALGAVAAQPLADLVEHLGLQRLLAPGRRRPPLEEGHDARRRQLEEQVLGPAQLGPRAGQRRVGVDEVGRRVGRAAVLAGVAVLVRRAALGAGALDVAVGQEHRLDRVVELLDRLGVDEAARVEPTVDVLRQLDVLGRVGRVPVVEADVEAVEVLRPGRRDPGDELAAA